MTGTKGNGSGAEPRLAGRGVVVPLGQCCMVLVWPGVRM